MKKIAIAAAVAATIASVEAAPFNGFSLGGNVGAAFTKYKAGTSFADIKATYNGAAGKLKDFAVAANMSAAEIQDIESFYNNASVSKTNFAADIYAGYTKSFASNLFAGADLGFNFENLSGAGKSGNVFGISFAPRFGYKFNETTGAYVKVAVGSQFMNKEMKTYLKSSAFFVTPTLGVEKAFGNVSVRGEVGYKIQNLETKKANDVTLANGRKLSVDSFSIKKNAFIVTVGASYNF